MSHDLRNLPAYLSNDADFRAWGSGLSAQLLACGLVKSSTTNNVDWTTVTKPGSINTFCTGAEVWRFNDAAQASAPIYMRFAFGVGGAVDRPRVLVAIGSSHTGDAAVQVGGQLQTGLPFSGPTTSKTAGAVLPSYVSGNGSYIAIATNIDVATAGFEAFFICERPLVNGVRSTDGVFAMSLREFAGSSANQSCMIPASGALGTISAVNSGGIWLPWGLGATGHPLNAQIQAGSENCMSPGLVGIGGKVGLITGFASYKHANVGAGTAVAVDTNEGAVNYFPFGNVVPYNNAYQVGAAGASTGFAIRWD